MIRDVRTLFEQKEEACYWPKRVNNFWNNNCIEYEINGDKNRTLSLDEYLNKTKPYLRNIIIDLQNSGTWKIQLTRCWRTACNSLKEWQYNIYIL